MFNVIKTTLIELPFIQNDASLQRYFPVQNFLRTKKVVSIEVYSANDYPNSPITPVNVLPDSTQFKTAFLTLYGDNPETQDAPAVWMDTIPFPSMHRVNNGIDPFVFEQYTMIARKIVWEKSYIQLTEALANTDAATSFCLLVGYLGNEGDN